jgi:hypothetical protein
VVKPSFLTKSELTKLLQLPLYYTNTTILDNEKHVEQIMILYILRVVLKLCTRHMLHKKRFVTRSSSHRINSSRNQIILNITSTYIFFIIRCNECTTARIILNNISHVAVAHVVGGAAQ